MDDAAKGNSITMTEQGRDPKRMFDEHLAAEIHSLMASALAMGDVDAEQLSRTERLHKLVILVEALEQPRRRRWPFVVFFIGTMVLLTVLLFVRVPSTRVLIDATALAITVGSSREQLLNAPVQVSKLELSPLKSVWIAGNPIEEVSTTTSTGAWLRVGLIRDSATTAAGQIVVPSFVLGSSDTLVLRAEPNNFRMSLYGGARTYNVSGRGETEIVTNMGYQDTVNFGEISPLEAVCCTGMPLVVAFPPPADTLASRSFAEVVYVRRISFGYQHHVADREVSADRMQSGLVTAEIAYQSLSGKTKSLRRGEHLRFRRADGSIRIELVNDRMRISFDGIVSGMSTGDYRNPRSLMPTLFEWLQAQHGVWLLWGVATYLVSSLSGLILWWRSR